jgi:hypothetical protein
VAIRVVNTNRAPTLTPLAPQSGRENAVMQFTLTATDIDQDPLSYSALLLPAGATFDSATRTLRWTPSFAQAGTYAVTFAAKDPSGGVDDVTVNLTVANVNRAPKLSVTDHTAVLGRTLQFGLVASDDDAATDPGTTLSYKAVGLPAGASVNSGTGSSRGTRVRRRRAITRCSSPSPTARRRRRCRPSSARRPARRRRR